MPPAAGSLLEYFYRLVGPAALQSVADRHLLAAFAGHRDQAAFAALVARHGPMVLNVCHRILGNAHAAEDAYQAVFMVLARKAKSLRRGTSLPAWLYGVARRVALKARGAAKRRPISQSLPHDADPVDPRPDPLEQLSARDLLRLVEAEIQRLPKSCRLPVALCCLDGLSVKEAARRLGLSEGAVKGRLERGRSRLHARLLRRGLTLSAGLGALEAASGCLSAGPPKLLAAHTVKAALTFASGVSHSGHSAALVEASSNAIKLANYGLKGAAMFKAKLILAASVLAGVTAFGADGLLQPGGVADQPGQQFDGLKIAFSAPVDQPPPKADQPRLDLHGDPLPEGAVARLGTVRWRVGTLTPALAFSPNGQVLAAMGDYHMFAGCLWLWDASSGRPLHQLGVSTADESLAFSPDGKLLFTAYTCSLIDVATGKMLGRLEGPAPSGRCVAAFSPDGRTVAVGGLSVGVPQLVVWDIDKPKEPRRFEGHSKAIYSVAFSPEGKTLASGSRDNTVRLWDVGTGKELRRFEGAEEAEIRFLVFSPGGALLVGLGDNRTFNAAQLQDRLLGKVKRDAAIHLWDTETGKLIRKLKANGGDIFSMAMAPDGKTLACGGRNGMICLLDPESGKELRSWLAHSFDVYGLAYSPDSKVLVSSGQSDRIVRRWDPISGKEIGGSAGHTKKVVVLRVSPDGKKITSCALDGTVVEWDVAAGKSQGRLFAGPHVVAEPGWRVNCLDLSPDRKTLAVTGGWWVPALKGDWKIRLTDTVSGTEQRQIDGHVPGPGQRVFAGGITRLQFSPDGNLLASTDSHLRVWDVATGAGSLHFFGGVQLGEFAFSPNGKWLALAGYENKGKSHPILLWSVAEKKILRRWDTPHSSIGNLLFSPDGLTLASVGRPADKVVGGLDVRLWGSETGKPIAAMKPLQAARWSKDDEVESVAFSASGRLLALGARHRLGTGQLDGSCTIHLFEVFTGEQIKEIRAPQGEISTLAFSPDGRMLASGGGDSTILLWDLASLAAAGNAKTANWTTQILNGFWNDLRSDASKADQALWALALAPQHSMPFLKERLQPIPSLTGKEIATLLTALDSDNFAERQRAAQDLEKLGESAEAAVRKHLEGKPTLEVRQRLQQFLDNRDKDANRKLRAIEVLEQIGTADARQVLETLAKEAPNPRVTEGATAALKRLAKR